MVRKAIEKITIGEGDKSMKKLIDRVTKKHIEEAYALAEKRGYWSTEVREYYEKFSYSAMLRLDTRVKVKIREKGKN